MQVRTQLQHDWAQAMERLGESTMGRGIRCGGQPSEPEKPLGKRTQGEVVDLMRKLSDGIREYEALDAEAVRTGVDGPALEAQGETCLSLFDQVHDALKAVQLDARSMSLAGALSGTTPEGRARTAGSSLAGAQL